MRVSLVGKTVWLEPKNGTSFKLSEVPSVIKSSVKSAKYGRELRKSDNLDL